jgi:hypothetical protein
MTIGGSLSESVGITYSWSMIFFGKPVPTFPDHALASHLDDDVKITARLSDAVEPRQMLFWIRDAPSGRQHECDRPQAQGGMSAVAAPIGERLRRRTQCTRGHRPRFFD